MHRDDGRLYSFAGLAIFALVAISAWREYTLASVDRPELRHHLVFTAGKWRVYQIDQLR